MVPGKEEAQKGNRGGGRDKQEGAAAHLLGNAYYGVEENALKRQLGF